jgi:mono/diheme cytochrome c family protein
MTSKTRVIGGAAGLMLLAATSPMFLKLGSAGAEDADQTQIARGQSLYGAHCASCHGKNLEGQPDWQTRLPTGRLPAPPHDASGHTWHHPDKVLLGITRNGLKPYAGGDYESDMPAFASILTDQEIGAVLAFIKSTWPDREREYQNRMTAKSKTE